MSNLRNAFLGSSKHTLENGNRIIIPSDFRKFLSPEFVLFRAPGKCLFIYQTETFDEMLDEINERSDTPEGLKNARKLAKKARRCSLDKQGRFTIPSEFIDYANLGSTVYLLGTGRRLEIWNEESYLQQETEDDDDAFIPVRY